MLEAYLLFPRYFAWISFFKTFPGGGSGRILKESSKRYMNPKDSKRQKLCRGD
jgi:hypothetical protein